MEGLSKGADILSGKDETMTEYKKPEGTIQTTIVPEEKSEEEQRKLEVTDKDLSDKTSAVYRKRFDDELQIPVKVFVIPKGKKVKVVGVFDLKGRELRDLKDAEREIAHWFNYMQKSLMVIAKPEKED